MNLPPPSDWGRSLAEAQNQQAIETLQSNITRLAETDVALARLSQDNVHQIQSVDAVRAPAADALPANIVAFFNAGIRRIEKQSNEQRQLGLQTVAAVTGFGFDKYCVGFELVDGILQNAAKSQARQQPSGSQSAAIMSKTAVTKGIEEAIDTRTLQQKLKEMLHATRWFVVVEPEVEYPMRPYCETFHTYVKENYNKSLMKAREDLDFERVVFDDNRVGSFAEYGGQIAP
ncbi:hypothetical protein LX32DRAFT_720811 [Colletotrichum zoysiae]|uniref:Uncharacterized protein n=1 Tax=Colletotrichum zoysiae TaxID=1216348 RepID=A0AAD9HHQ9_9PEZI|nr:hypothetical protein LX32DRAFT_720811 [Colletotrichum zoysiae]